MASILASSRTALAAITSPADGDIVFLTEAGREGWFIWRAGDYSGEVTHDPRQGIYVAPASDTTGASGVWIRRHWGIVTAFMFGATDCTGAPKQGTEVVYDNLAALNGMWSIVKYLGTSKNELVAMSLAGASGLGLSGSWVLDADTANALWNKPTFRIFPGRLVAMGYMTNLIEVRGGNFETIGLWELWGGTDTQLNSGDYSQRYIKNGMSVYGVGGSRFGDITVQGARRYAVQYDKTYDIANNNIPTQWGKIIAIQCGCRTSDSVKFAGTYDSGSWTNNPADNNSDLQKHLLTLTPSAGCNVGDLEVGDLIDFNGFGLTPAIVRDIVSATSTTVTVNVFPWLPKQARGTFQSMHGGGVSAWGSNLANNTFELIENYSGGTGVQAAALYAPKINSFLAESTLCAVQLGQAGDSMEGVRFSHYHIESVNYSVIDFANCTGAYFGTASNLMGSLRGKFDLCVRPGPAQVFSGVWSTTGPQTLKGVTFDLNGGQVSSPVGMVGRTIGLIGGAIFGNAPENHGYGALLSCNSFTFALIADKSLAEKIAGGRIAPFGPIVGSGPGGAPTGTIDFTIFSTQGPVSFTGSISGTTLTVSGWSGGYITPEMIISGAGVAVGTKIVAYDTGTGANGTYTVDVSQTVGSTAMTSPGCTVEGGTSHSIPVGSGAIMGYAIYDSPATGDAGNWRIVAWRVDAAASAGGASAASGWGAFPIDPSTLSPSCWFDVQDLTSMWQDTAGTVAAAVGSPVARIDDKSGNGNHATQSNSGKRPILRKLAGIYYLEFDGVDDWMVTLVFTRAQPNTLAAGVMLADNGGTLQSVFFGITAIQTLQGQAGVGFQTYAGTALGAGTFNNAMHRLISEMNGASSNLYSNGSLLITGDAGTANCNGIYIGVANTEGIQFAKMLFFGGGVLPQLTAIQRKGVDAWLTAMMGM